MGWGGIEIKVEVVDDPVSEAELVDGMWQLVSDQWRVMLPPPWFKVASRWIGQGSDSLLVFQEPGGSPSEEQPAEALLFMFYDTVGWPSALAKHWLALALARSDGSDLRDTLRAYGYALAEGRLTLPAAWSRLTFVVDASRIGWVVEDGVEWQTAEPTHEPDADLSTLTRASAVAIRAGGSCQCPVCRIA